MAVSASSEVAGFRLERRLGDHVWEAVQPALGRRVALRRLPPGTAFDAARWPDHPGVVSLYAVAETPDGTYVATRFVPGARTLAECRRVRRRWLDAVAATLAAAPHGDLTARDVLIDPAGRVLVTGFGRPPMRDDAEALEALRHARRRPRMLVPAVLLLALAAVVAVVLAAGGDEGTAPPAALPGTEVVGSTLAAGPVTTVDCDGRPAGGNSLPCTIMQTALPGRTLGTSADGIVTRWAVRGARGRFALQVLLPEGDGYVVHNRSRIVTVDDPDTVAVFAADRSAPKGARFALEVTPGAAVGLRRGVTGAVTGRFFDPLRMEPPRVPGMTRDEELLLRVEVAQQTG